MNTKTNNSSSEALRSYIYSTMSTKYPTKRLFGTLKARHSFEALHNARFLVTERQGNPRFITLIPLN